MTTIILELDPHDVVVGDRFRPAEEKDVELRAQSLMRFGQLQPVGVFVNDEGKHELVYGLHRLEACKLNGMRVNAVLAGTEGPIMRKEIELEENIARKEMSWDEREDAIADLHKLKMATNPTWTQQQTQAVVDLPRRADVADSLKLSEMMKLFPELREAKSKHQALSWAKSKADLVMRKMEVSDGAGPDYSSIESRIILGNSVSVIKSVPSESFSLVLTDPPFGIDFDSRKAGTEGSLSSYQDDEENYIRLLSMAPDLFRVLKPRGFLVWFFGMSWYERCKSAFRDAGFTVDELPIVWNRSSGRCHTNRPDRYFSRGYDVALHCFKGDAQIIERGKPNVLNIDPVPSSDRDLLVERPVELYAELIRRLTVPGEVVADFFVGSGSCPAAAASLGRAYFGVEQSAERRAVAIKKIHAYTPTTGAESSAGTQTIQPAVA